MNKQQEKAYREYAESEKEAGHEPLAVQKWLEQEEQEKEQEKQEYLCYQKRIANSMLAEGPKKILNKDEWLKAGKPSGESKHEKFVRLAELRTSKAIKAIENMHTLSSATYESTDNERMQVISALRNAVDNLEKQFVDKKEVSTGFKLKIDEIAT